MLYKKLADLYEKLEATTKKLEKRDILADFYRDCPTQDLYKVVLLSMGTIYSAGELDLGIAAELVKRIIAKNTGTSDAEMMKKFKENGDLGLTAEFFSSNRKQRALVHKELTIDLVFDNLRKLPEIFGKGSQERKISLVSELLSSADPKEAKYIVRTILGDMRMGVAAGIVRDAIAKAFGKEPKEVEKSFDVMGDFGYVAEMAKKGKMKAKIVVGRPVRVMLADRSPDLETALKKFEEPALEFKYDGFRCIAGNTAIYTNPHGLKSVKDVRVGDSVLTHRGRFKKVIAINKRIIDKNEKIYRFQSYMGNEFRISEKHKILCKRGKKILWLTSDDIQNTDMLVFSLPRLQNKTLPNKMLLEDESGYKKEINMDENFYRFLGYWIGDGFTNEYHNTERVGLIFNSKYKDLIREYKKIIGDIFGVKEISEYKHKSNAISIYWRDKPLRIWLSRNFRIEWHGKTIPWWFVNINKSNFKAFLRGWSESDGYKSIQGTIKIITQERRLASLSQLIGIMHSIPLGLRRMMVKMPRKNYKKEYYQIIVPKSKKYAFSDGQYVYYKILKKEEIKRPNPRIRLYNLQIEDDESYCTNNAVLHNCQIHKNAGEIKIFSRRLDEVTNQFPEIVKWSKECIKAKTCIIEGEVLAVDRNGKPMPFQQLSRRIQRKYDIDRMVKEIPVQINLFELIYINGENWMHKPLHERWKKLNDVVKKTKNFCFADHIETKTLKDAEKFYKSALSAGQEGVIVKNLSAIYQPGKRVGFWLKVKPIMEPLDLIITGATWGEGRRAEYLGSLLLAARKGEKFLETGMMGSGLTDEQLKEVTKKLKELIIEENDRSVKVKPRLVIEVGYEEIQKSPKYPSGYALRFPRLLRIRSDEKRPEDINTIKDIEKLFNQQKKRR
ncbi:MAG: ATP-dependent DNA ligase [Candidatus Aenigmatarchaeota archaeon]